jgi:hypothetical protein
MAKSPKKRPSKSKPSKIRSAKPQRSAADPTNNVSVQARHNMRPTKQSQVIALLRSPSGISIAAMMKATGWQQHSVRGFLTGVVSKRLKLKLTSEKTDNGRVYRITEVEAGKTSSSKSSRPPA